MSTSLKKSDVDTPLEGLPPNSAMDELRSCLAFIVWCYVQKLCKPKPGTVPFDSYTGKAAIIGRLTTVDLAGSISASSFGDPLGRALWKDRATEEEVFHQTVEEWINPEGLHGEEHPAFKALWERYPWIGLLLREGKL